MDKINQNDIPPPPKDKINKGADATAPDLRFVMTPLDQKVAANQPKPDSSQRENQSPQNSITGNDCNTGKAALDTSSERKDSQAIESSKDNYDTQGARDNTNENNVIILPEITIEGKTDTLPQNSSDWWCEGFGAGFNSHPDAAAERPLMINDELAKSYSEGYKSGQDASKEIQAEYENRTSNMPKIGPPIRGESLEKIERHYKEQWEAVFHQHMPHTEVEGEPGPTIVRPNIVIYPK